MAQSDLFGAMRHHPGRLAEGGGMMRTNMKARELAEWLRQYCSKRGMTAIDLCGELHPNVRYRTCWGWSNGKTPMSAINQATVRRYQGKVK